MLKNLSPVTVMTGIPAVSPVSMVALPGEVREPTIQAIVDLRDGEFVAMRK